MSIDRLIDSNSVHSLKYYLIPKLINKNESRSFGKISNFYDLNSNSP